MTIFSPRSILVSLAALLLATGNLAAQQTQPFFRNLNTEDGLPSSETHCAFQDREGYMWFGTDNGVARYDGYEFKVYGIEEGLTDVVVFNVREDKQGVLWVGTYSGRAFFLKNDHFYPHKFNDRLIDLKSANYTINLIDIGEDGSMIYKVNNEHYYLLDDQGQISRITQLMANKANTISPLSEGEYTVQHGIIHYRVIDTSKPRLKLTFLSRQQGQWSELLSTQLDQQLFEHEYQDYSPPRFAYRDGEPIEILANIKNIYFYVRGPDVYYVNQQINFSQMFMPHRDRGFWVGMGRGEGLMHYYLEEEAGDTHLKVDTVLYGNSVSYAYYDNEGGLWVCTIDQGIFYSSNPDLSTHRDEGISSSSKPISIQVIDENSYYVGYENRRLGYRDVARYQKFLFSVPHPISRSIRSLAYYPESRRVVSSLGSFFHPFPIDGAEAFQDLSLLGGYVGEYLLYQPYVDREKLNLSSVGLAGQYDMITTDVNIFSRFSTSTTRVASQCFGVHYDGRPLLGTMEGIYVIKADSTLVKDNLGLKELNGRVISINNLINGATLFGTRGQGLVFLGEKGSNVITTKDGLVSDIIRRIHQSKNGDIWIATLSGLTKLRLSVSGEIEEIRSFGLEHGLASKEIHDINSYNNQVWLATSKGVIRFREPPLDTSAQRPFIQWLQFDGRQYSADSTFDFTAGQHDLKVAFSAFNYRMLGNIPFRYRLQADQDWQYTHNRLVEYPNLPPDDYHFEVQCQNQDGYWSESALLPLNIPATWYNRWPVRIVGLLLLIGLIAGIFALREKNHRHEQALARQIDELERAAKQAQMNPHFIFNSLNSIQYFILNNEVKEAVYYLSRFASLIRQTLRSSVRGVHTLKEEVDMLDTYLSLEKLRYKDSFEYRIVVGKQLPQDHIRLSPLLVQPFVENALLHGLADFDTGGLLVVEFQGSARELIITIEDNGCGFDVQQEMSTDSMGMSITRKRLELYKHKRSSSPQKMRVEALTDQNGLPFGTRITLRVSTK